MSVWTASKEFLDGNFTNVEGLGSPVPEDRGDKTEVSAKEPGEGGGSLERDIV